MSSLTRRSLASRRSIRGVWSGALVALAACSSANPGARPADDVTADGATATNDSGAGASSDALGLVAEGGPAPDTTRTLGDGGTANDAKETGNESGLAPNGPPDHCGGVVLSDGGTCPGRRPGALTIIGSTYSVQGSAIAYGTDPDVWDVYPFSDPGQAAPSLTPNVGAVSMSATFDRSATGQHSAGFGVSMRGANCVDESNFARGVVFTLSGDLGGCALFIDVVTSEDESSASDPCRGTCTQSAGPCIAPTVEIASLGTNTVPNMSFFGGSPTSVLDARKLIGFRWRLQTPDALAGVGCAANVTIGSVALLGQ